MTLKSGNEGWGGINSQRDEFLSILGGFSLSRLAKVLQVAATRWEQDVDIPSAIYQQWFIERLIDNRPLGTAHPPSLGHLFMHIGPLTWFPIARPLQIASIRAGPVPTWSPTAINWVSSPEFNKNKNKTAPLRPSHLSGYPLLLPLPKCEPARPPVSPLSAQSGWSLRLLSQEWGACSWPVGWWQERWHRSRREIAYRRRVPDS